MRNSIFKCTFLLQGPNEPSQAFSERIQGIVEALYDDENVIYTAPVQVTCDAQGRKEAFIQWSKNK